MTVLQLKRSMDARFRRLERRLDQRFATKDDLRQFGTKDDLRQFATKDDLRQFATKDDLRQFGTKDDLRQFATKDDLRRFATKDDLRQFATKHELLETEQRLKRHLSVMVESIHDDMRMFAEAIGANTERLGNHEQRIRKLERLT